MAPQIDPWADDPGFKRPSGAAPTSTPTAPPEASNDDWKVFQQGGSTPEQPSGSIMSQAGGAIKNAGIGALKGLGSTSQGLLGMMAPRGSFLNSDPQMNTTPQGTAQKVGKGLEQAAEFAVPIGGPESKLARIGMEAARGGLVNKAQGGSFGAGAAMGGAGEGLAQGVKAVAPGLAESALNIRKTDRAYKPGGAIGKSILNETRGVRPGTVAESAQARLNTLTPELEQAAAKSTAPTSLAPARDIINEAGLKAYKQNAAQTFGQLKPMSQHLTRNFLTQRPISQTPTPSELLNLKRGFGDEFVHSWNPETMTGVKGTAGRTYHALGEEFNRAVPEARDLNSRISNLIPVTKRGESAELNAPTSQRVAGRLLAHTGALTGAGFGGAAGYHKGGPLGALIGGAAGLAAPEMLASPTGQMVVARTLGSGGVRPLIRAAGGGLLQAGRGKSKDQEQ